MTLIIHPQVLRDEAKKTLAAIDEQIEAMERHALNLNIEPTSLRDSNEGWVIAPLLLARSSCLLVLAMTSSPR